MHLKGTKCSGGKNSKILLTGVAAANVFEGKFQCLFWRNHTNPVALRGLKSLHVDTVRKKRVGWISNYLENGSENRTESLC